MAANTSAAPAPAAAAAPVPAAAGAAPAASGAAPRSVGFASTSLYVGDLAAEVTDAHLFEIFQQVGPVASVRVCRDAATRRSLGYAYVNFHTSVDAERALDTMNFREIRGKACRIMWSQRDPSIRKSGLGNVFVKGLAKSIDHKSLYDSFSIFGNILSCKVSQHPRTKESLGYGFVQFADEQAAEAAIGQANNTSLANQRITVAAFKPKRDRGGNDKARFTNVFVKNIPPSVDSKEKLIELFAKHGEVNSAALTFPPPLPEKKRKDGKTDEKDAKDQKERTRTAFGFVNFRTPEQATAAVNAMNGFEIGGSKLYVSRAQKKEERERENKERLEKERNERHSKYANTNLYVKNLTDAIDDERLRNEFKQYGAISSAKVMRDTNGKSRGFGFVCFNSPEEATRAVTNMNGVLLDSKPLYVALAQRKEVRRATLEALYARRGTMPVYPFPGVGMVGPVVQQPMYRGAWNGPYVQQPMMPRANRVPYQQMPQQMMQFGGMIPVQPRGPMGAQGAGAGGRGRGGAMRGRGGAASGRPVPQGAAAGVQPARRPAAATAGQPQQVKYNQNVRNQPQAAAAQPVSQPVQDTQVEVDPASQPLDSTALAKLPEDQRKQVLGERLFPLIHEKQPELAGKITGMLLEMDNSELLHLLENPQALNEKIDEALHVLKTHDDAGAQ